VTEKTMLAAAVQIIADAGNNLPHINKIINISE